MRRIIWTAIIAGLIGFVAGNAFWYLASPLWIDREVSEAFVATDETVTLASGSFSGADRLHQGEGQATAFRRGAETVLRFTGFEVTNGPDLYVWLVRDGAVASSEDVKASEVLELGVLKGNVGDQNYTLPEGADIAEWGAVVIWCRRFGVLFASAPLAGA